MFWQLENINPNNIALIDDVSEETITFETLKERCDRLSNKFYSTKKKLIFLFCDNSILSITSYLAALRSRQAILLLNTKMDRELRDSLIKIYKPEIILSTESFNIELTGYKLISLEDKLFFYQSNESENNPIHPELALLLSTSGTTGSPKLVRLSYKNISANASSISEYLKIKEDEKPITSLPINYSYGLSVINSHLLNGASIVCSNKSMLMREFWNIFNKNKCTSFAGVPYNYQMLQRLKFDKMEIPSLKTMTQAGGRLSEEFVKYFYDVAIKRHINFFVMYGQTEATARISYVPFEKLIDKIGSIGISVPQGEIKIFHEDKEITSPGIEGELVYFGPNVMMGYAESRADLMKDDELKGILHTGDLACKDKDGFYYITGRLKRFIKLFGLRVNLDEVEKMIENHFSFPAACYGTDDTMKILIQTNEQASAELVKRYVVEIYKLHHSVLQVKCVQTIPVTTSGKRDYKKIQSMVV